MESTKGKVWIFLGAYHQALSVENNVSNVQKAKVRKSYIEYMQITVKRLNGKCSCKATYKSMENLWEDLPRE